eukprot:scpid85690/ scgid2114/ 
MYNDCHSCNDCHSYHSCSGCLSYNGYRYYFFTILSRDSFIWQLGTALSVFVYMCMIVHSVHSRPKTEGTCCTTLSNLRSVPERPVAESVVLLSCNDGFQEANAIGVFCQQQWPRHYLLFDGIA